MTLTTLVIGGSASSREAAIAVLLDRRCSTALILEGLPDGNDCFANLIAWPDVQVKRIAPGCVCCIGNITLRVTLNRILRHPPARLFLSLAAASHIEEVQQFLMQAPYDALLKLTDDIRA